MNIFFVTKIQNAYKEYTLLPLSIKNYLNKTDNYIKMLLNYIKIYQEHLSNKKISDIVNKEIKMITSHVESLKKLKKELEQDLINVENHIKIYENKIFFKNLITYGVVYLKNITPYVMEKIKQDYQNIINHVKLLKNKFEIIDKSEIVIKNTKSNYNKIISLAQDKGVYSIVTDISKGLKNIKGIVTLGLVVVGLGILSTYIRPFTKK